MGSADQAGVRGNWATLYAPFSQRRTALLVAVALLTSLFTTSSARAFEFFDGRLQMHGFYQMELRALMQGWNTRNAYLSQWAHTLNLEIEADIAPDGIGPFDVIQAYARIEVRYDCVWSSACHLNQAIGRMWGPDAKRAPARHFADGRFTARTGHTTGLPDSIEKPERVISDGLTYEPIWNIPPLRGIIGLGGPNTRPSTRKVFNRCNNGQAPFSVMHIESATRTNARNTIGPMNMGDNRIEAIGACADVEFPNTPSALPMRPLTPILYQPSQKLLDHKRDYDSFDQNFTESEMKWNRGASQQQTKELRELYFDIEMFDGSLFFRLGRQTIVWGKTELFRAQDQFNPQDLALSTLPSLEQSRIPLWAARMIWSAYDIGPFEDVRVELAANIDHFEPADLGACGEPYTIFLVCTKSLGLFVHGMMGFGLAGEKRPQDPWNSIRGLEFGARVEFRMGRFSFAITDFYGFNDFPVAETFNIYDRNVDPDTGRPRIQHATGPCTDGTQAACLTAANSLAQQSGNRQFFDILCDPVRGILADLGETLNPGAGLFADNCAFDVFNSQDPVLGGVTLPAAIGLGMSNAVNWTTVKFLFETQLGVPVGSIPTGTRLHAAQNPTVGGISAFANDGDTAGTSNQANLHDFLSPEQEGLLGCGPFYNPDGPGDYTDRSCDQGDNFPGVSEFSGIDFMNAEGSVLFQSFTAIATENPVVATRLVNGKRIILPGARSPFDFFGQPAGYRYDPAVDGCVGDINALFTMGLITVKERNAIPHKGVCNGAAVLTDPVTGKVYNSEMAALSRNFEFLLGGLSPASEPENGLCPAVKIETCIFVRALVSSVGVQRPDYRGEGNGRVGRRDFVWLGGTELELRYEKRNVFGISMDFAEDVTKTNWGIEFTWFEDQAYENRDKLKSFSKHDTLTLTISVDRPTFINFLNANRTFFFNSQVFLRYIPRYQSGGAMVANGPLSALATFTFFTGFYQDRLLPAVTFVHEVESNSGGQIASLTYRMTEVFSVSVGITNFYGKPGSRKIPITQALLSSTLGGDFRERFNFQGVSPVWDREEVNLTVRYTF